MRFTRSHQFQVLSWAPACQRATVVRQLPAGERNVRSGAFRRAAPLLGPLPARSSRGEEEKLIFVGALPRAVFGRPPGSAKLALGYCLSRLSPSRSALWRDKMALLSLGSRPRLGGLMDRIDRMNGMGMCFARGCRCVDTARGQENCFSLGLILRSYAVR